MSGYLYDLPTTGALSLSELCTDITGSHAAQLVSATEARANVRAVLKASRRADAGERDYLKVVKVRFSRRCEAGSDGVGPRRVSPVSAGHHRMCGGRRLDACAGSK
jgi:hypothetical protein